MTNNHRAHIERLHAFSLSENDPRYLIQAYTPATTLHELDNLHLVKVTRRDLETYSIDNILLNKASVLTSKSRNIAGFYADLDQTKHLRWVHQYKNTPFQVSFLCRNKIILTETERTLCVLTRQYLDQFDENPSRTMTILYLYTHLIKVIFYYHKD